jgi:hypothetical protein
MASTGPATANYNYAIHIVWCFKRTMVCMLFHELIINDFCLPKTQYNVMHMHCLSMQRNQGQVSGIENHEIFFITLIMLMLMSCHVMCRMHKKSSTQVFEVTWL